MRAFGVIAAIIGALMLIGALVMDVSVPTGIGRVNNLGLMAERQNYTIIGGILLIVGILMARKTSSKATVAEADDVRQCPACAELIKKAATKCRFCGEAVEPVAAPKLKQGWVAFIPCRPGEDRDRSEQAVVDLGLPVVPMDGANIGAGPFSTKEEAKAAVKRLSGECSIYATVDYRDTVSGKFPPLPD